MAGVTALFNLVYLSFVSPSPYSFFLGPPARMCMYHLSIPHPSPLFEKNVVLFMFFMCLYSTVWYE